MLCLSEAPQSSVLRKCRHLLPNIGGNVAFGHISLGHATARAVASTTMPQNLGAASRFSSILRWPPNLGFVSEVLIRSGNRQDFRQYASIRNTRRIPLGSWEPRELGTMPNVD
jgi:hypothetical protein